MKTLFTILCFLGIMTFGQGQTYSVSDIVLSPASPAKVEPGHYISISFDYTKPAGDIRIFVRPMYGGELAANYAASGTGLYTANSGTVIADFTLTQPGLVDQLRFQFLNSAGTTVLYEYFRDVDYSFVDYDISNVVLTPLSPAYLDLNQHVDVTFNFVKSGADVRIFSDITYLGQAVSGAATQGSPLYTTNTGSGSSFFTLTLPGRVDMLTLTITDATGATVLYETEVAIDYIWADYDISNVVFTPATPAKLAPNDEVSLTFNYKKLAGNVMILARPMFDGGLAANYVASGSPIYHAETGTGTGDFTLSVPGYADQVRFQILTSDGTIVLYEEFFPVSFTWINYEISDVSLNPPSPAIIPENQNVTVSFKYSKPDADVRIYAMPMFSGSPAVNYATSGSPIYTGNAGTGTATFTLTDIGSVDQLRFQVTDVSGEHVAFEYFVNVDYKFGSYGITDVTFNPVSPAKLAVNQIVSVGFNYSKPDGDARIFVALFLNGTQLSNFTYQGSPLYVPNSGSAATQFSFTSPGQANEVRFLMMDATATTLYHQVSIPVDFSCVPFEITSMTFDPVTPDIIQFGQNVSMNFRYAKPDMDVRIFIEPMFDGLPAANYSVSGSPIYTGNTGSGTGHFTLTAPGTVDGVRLTFTDTSVSQNVLFTQLYVVNYSFQDLSSVNLEELTNRLTLFPVPCNDQFLISCPGIMSMEYKVYNLMGSLLIFGSSQTDEARVNTGDLPSGTYLVRVLIKDKIVSKILVKQ